MSRQIVSGGRESGLRSITLVAWERSAVRSADPASRRNTRSHQQQSAAAGAPVDRRAHAGPDAFSVRCCHRSCRVCAGGQLVGPYDASVAEGMKRGDMEQSSRARSCTVGDLDELDISHRIGGCLPTTAWRRDCGRFRSTTPHISDRGRSIDAGRENEEGLVFSRTKRHALVGNLSP